VIFALNFLSGSFYYIPQSSLAAVLIGAVMFMIDYEAVLPMWRISSMHETIKL
jgi:MFS superfamily sulfate permease-like transporter